MPHPCRLDDPSAVASPQLVFAPAVIEANIAAVVQAAGGPGRLRPHAKTHKTIGVTRLQLAAGVTKHKCATIAEAEMLAVAGVPDVLLAYPAVGPTATRLAALAKAYPLTFFSALVDSDTGATHLADAAATAGVKLGYLVDLDVGQHRTGIAPERAVALYQSLATRLTPNGLHAYDGHNTAERRGDRDALARQSLAISVGVRDELRRRGLPCPRIVAGGTPGFPSYASIADVPDLELSPGTYVLHDHGYGTKYPDIAGVTPAAVVLTRVVSKPTANRVTFDCGTKSIASDPPAGKRLTILDDPTLVPVGHNEEHYVCETATPDRWPIGAVAYALPTHICPTVALYREALLVATGQVTGAWEVAGRDRRLTV
jgi:D-serine deaminase-like pyridoxal phosphate-dependent protein